MTSGKFAHSAHNLADDMGSLNAGEADVEPLELGREAAVVDPAEVEHGGVEVADMDGDGDGIACEG